MALSLRQKETFINALKNISGFKGWKLEEKSRYETFFMYARRSKKFGKQIISIHPTPQTKIPYPVMPQYLIIFLHQSFLHEWRIILAWGARWFFFVQAYKIYLTKYWRWGEKKGLSINALELLYFDEKLHQGVPIFCFKEFEIFLRSQFIIRSKTCEGGNKIFLMLVMLVD